jgi:hypothetical protein
MSVKIIKQGNLKNATYRFTCPNCECIFEADGDSVSTDLSRNASGCACNQRHLATCPCCGRFVAGIEVSESGRA